MDTETLIAESKARFTHNAAKEYLKEKYESKLILADQGGLWRANTETIAFLNYSKQLKVVLVDTFGNPVEVDRNELLSKLTEVYEAVMKEWYIEWNELETKR